MQQKRPDPQGVPERFYDLQRMIASCPVEKTPEIDEVMNLLERIYEDGVVTPDEHSELMSLLKKNFQLGPALQEATMLTVKTSS